MGISPFGWIFLILTTAFVPWAAMRAAFRVRRSGRAPARRQYLASIALTQGWFLALALATSRTDRIRLFPAPDFGGLGLMLAALFLVVALGTLPLRWKWKPAEERKHKLWIYPQSPRDFAWWIPTSLSAGIVEELVYRGVMFTLCHRVLGSWPGAVAVSAVAFALAHYVQGWRAMVVIVPFSIVFHLIVWLTGDLYTVMATHAVYDLGAGVIVLKLAGDDRTRLSD